MKPIRQLTIAAAVIAMLAIAYTPLRAKNYVTPKAYMFGFTASFTDSTVYFTNIQEVDSVWFMHKRDILAGRSSYSSQLRTYCTDKLKQPKRTCIVIGSPKRKDVEKKYEKMKRQYTQNKKGATYDVKFISEEEFKFQSVNMNDNEEQASATKSKKNKKKEAKAPKRKGKDGKTPPPPTNK